MRALPQQGIKSGWKRRRLGHLIQFRNGKDTKSVEAADGAHPVYGSGGEFKRADAYLYDGPSILFGRKGTLDKPLLVHGKFWTVDTMFYTIPGPEVDPKFVHYWALTVPYQVLSTDTAVPSMTSTDLGQLYIHLPKLETQRAIADYLDRETAEIDAMTADLDKMEKLLTERRDATLARLLSDAEQSGMQIRNVRVKFLCDIGTGHGDTQDASDGGAYPFYVRSANVLRSSEWDIQGPAVLTAGDGAGVGRVFHYAEGKMKVHQRVYALTNFRNVNPRFFYEAFRQYFPETVLYGGASSTVSSLRMHMLADLNLPIPPLEEQRRITAEIDRETAEIDAMLADIMELRDLLAERRAAVIAAAVTGQIEIPTAKESPNA